MDGSIPKPAAGGGDAGSRAGTEALADGRRLEQSAGVGRQAVHGVLWTYFSVAGSKFLVFVSTVILARLLIPSEFGQVAFALLVISYMEAVGDFGVGSALIYEREQPEEAANVAFIVSLASGLLWFAGAFAAAPLVAEFFNDPAVTPILRTMAFVFVIKALGNTHDALLRRDLAFKKRLVPDLAMASLKGLCAVALALAGWGVWSLVWGHLIGTAAATVGFWAMVRWRPGLRASWRTARRMLGYGSHIMSVNVMAAIVYHADFVIVGRLLGSAALGLYGLAYRTPEFFISVAVWVVGNVTFPVYSKLRQDPEVLRSAFLVTLRYLALLMLPMGIGLALVAGPFVSAFYGEQWHASILPLQVLALVATLRAFDQPAGDVYKATGRAAILTKMALVRAAVLIPVMIWSARYGLAGVALAQLGVTAASTLLNQYVAGRVLLLPARSILGEFKTPLAGAAAMVAALYLLMPLLSEGPQGVALAAGAFVGACVYAATIWLVGGETIKQACSAAISLFRRA